MNHSIYIFGKLGAGFTQYPDDYTKRIFQVPITKLQCVSQIVLYREGNLVYYTYYRKILGEGSFEQYIGFSVCFNSVFCTNVNDLFEIFEHCVADLAINGRIIEFSNDGDIISNTDSLYLQQVEINRLVSLISNEIDNISDKCFHKIPPVNYGGEKNSIRVCPIDDAEKQIHILLKEIDTIIFQKNNNYNTSLFTGFALKLKELFSKNKDLEKENSELKESNKILIRRKKQFRLVALLTVIILISLITLLILRNNIDTLRGEVAKNEVAILEKNDQIDSLNRTILILNDIVKKLNGQIIDKDNEINEITDFLGALKSNMICPFSITNIEVKNDGQEYGETINSSNTTYIYSRMTAYSLIEGDVDIYIKFYTPEKLSHYAAGTHTEIPSDYSYKSTVKLEKNRSTTLYLNGWGGKDKGHWKSGSYRIEYWYNGVQLATKYFYIN